MNDNKKRIELRNSNIPLTFGIRFSADNDTVIVKYVDNFEDELVKDFYIFLDDLSQYYRNRIDSYEGFNEKLNLCNKFLDTIQGYKMNLRNTIDDNEKFFKEIDFHKEQFNYLKSRFIEVKDLKVSQSDDKIISYSTKQQILIFEYLGGFKLMSEINLEKHKAKIISAIIGKNFDNTKKALENNSKKVLKGTETKTKENLIAVRDLFMANNLSEIANKIQQDINSITKG